MIPGWGIMPRFCGSGDTQKLLDGQKDPPQNFPQKQKGTSNNQKVVDNKNIVCYPKHKNIEGDGNDGTEHRAGSSEECL